MAFLLSAFCFMTRSSFPISFALTYTKFIFGLRVRNTSASTTVQPLSREYGKTNTHATSPLQLQSTKQKVKPETGRAVMLHSPPIGALYELVAKIPILGEQRFRLKIVNEGIAELVIDGLLAVNDSVHYNVTHDGDFVFELSDTTKEVLKRFKTDLVKVRYCNKTDTSIVIVRPPLPTNIKLSLKRRPPSSSLKP